MAVVVEPLAILSVPPPPPVPLPSLSLVNGSLFETALPNVSDIQKRSHPCPLCGRVFFRPLELKDHMNTHSVKFKKHYECVHCTKVFSQRRSLLSHSEKKHKHMKDPQLSPPDGTIIHRLRKRKSKPPSPRKRQALDRVTDDDNILPMDDDDRSTDADHQMDSSSSSEDNSTLFACLNCDIFFPNTETLTLHSFSCKKSPRKLHVETDVSLPTNERSLGSPKTLSDRGSR